MGLQKLFQSWNISLIKTRKVFISDKEPFLVKLMGCITETVFKQYHVLKFHIDSYDVLKITLFFYSSLYIVFQAHVALWNGNINLQIRNSSCPRGPFNYSLQSSAVC